VSCSDWFLWKQIIINYHFILLISVSPWETVCITNDKLMKITIFFVYFGYIISRVLWINWGSYDAELS
jgi:hypothetical protein